MRKRLKFKVWDKLNNCWHEPTYEAYAGKLEELIIDTNGLLLMRTLKGLYGGQDILDRFETVEFIGKQDKNKRDIYVGDIVKTCWQHDGVRNYDYEVTGEIQFVEDYLQFMIVVDKGSEVTYYPLHSFERDELDEESIEIIGNRFENKHLLEAAE